MYSEVVSHSAIISCDSYASLVHGNLLYASITRRTDANHEPIVIITFFKHSLHELEPVLLRYCRSTVPESWRVGEAAGPLAYLITHGNEKSREDPLAWDDHPRLLDNWWDPTAPRKHGPWNETTARSHGEKWQTSENIMRFLFISFHLDQVKINEIEKGRKEKREIALYFENGRIWFNNSSSLVLLAEHMDKMSGSRSLGWHGINSSTLYHLSLESVHFINQSNDEGSGKLEKKNKYESRLQGSKIGRLPRSDD